MKCSFDLNWQSHDCAADDLPEGVIIEIFNGSGIGTLKCRLAASDAHVLLAQEVGITPDLHGDFSQWLIGKGWRMLLAPAEPRPGGYCSVGVTLFARHHFGLRWFGDSE